MGAVLLMPLSSLLLARLGGTGGLTRLAALAFACPLTAPGWPPCLGTPLGAAFALGT